MPELVPYQEVQQRLGVSKTTLTRFARQYGFTEYKDPRDGRRKLLDWEEVEKAMRPRRIGPAQPKKAAA